MILYNKKSFKLTSFNVRRHHANKGRIKGIGVGKDGVQLHKGHLVLLHVQVDLVGRAKKRKKKKRKNHVSQMREQKKYLEGKRGRFSINKINTHTRSFHKLQVGSQIKVFQEKKKKRGTGKKVKFFKF